MPGSALSAHERGEILVGIGTEQSLVSTARRLVRPPSPIAREVARNGGQARYRAATAHRRAGAKAGTRAEVDRPGAGGYRRDRQ